jgi:hypothetical protein
MFVQQTFVGSAVQAFSVIAEGSRPTYVCVEFCRLPLINVFIEVFYLLGYSAE